MPLLAVTIGVLLGTVLGLRLPTPHPPAGSALLGLVLLGAAALVGWRSLRVRLICVLFLAALLAGARAQATILEITSAAVPGDSTAIRGVVSEVPRPVGRASVFVVDVTEVRRVGSWERWEARLEAHTFGRSPQEGDKIEAAGKIRIITDLPGAPRATLMRRRRVTQEMDVEQLRIQRSARAETPASWLSDARLWMEGQLTHYLGNPEGALTAGLLLGSRAGLPPDLRAQFAQTGTSHIVAVSGYNVVIVAGICSHLASRLTGPRGSAVAAMLAVVVYTVLVGAPASATRAALMTGAVLTARVVRRPSDSFSGLLTAGAAMALVDPLVVQDLGFQLSMLATSGLILLIPPMDGVTARWRWAFGLIMTPLAAQVATLPLTLHTFHTLSLVALMANIPLTVLVPAAMASGAALVLLSPIERLASLAAWVAWAPAFAILELVRWCAALPGAYLSTGQFPAWAMLSCYAALTMWVLIRSSDVTLRPVIRMWLRAIAPATVLAAFIGASFDGGTGGALVGELLQDGDVVIAQSPSGRTIVIFTDASPPVLVASIAERVPLWKRGVDVLVMAEPGPRAWRAVAAVAERYVVDTLLVPIPEPVDVRPPGVQRVVLAETRTMVDLGDGASLMMEAATAPSARGRAGIMLRYHATGFYFPPTGGALIPPREAGAWITLGRAARGAPGMSLSMPGASTSMGARGSLRGDESSGAGPYLGGGIPIKFRSDGEQLTIHWRDCGGPDTECSALVPTTQVTP